MFACECMDMQMEKDAARLHGNNPLSIQASMVHPVAVAGC